MTKKMRPANLLDLTGKKFGKLTVVERSDKKSKRGAVWVCECDCGNTTTVVASDLTGGKTHSCGCGWVEAGKKVVKHNEESKIDGVFTPLLTKNSPTGESGVKGVRKRVRKNGTVRWQAHIGLKNKDIYLGSFETIDQAAKAREEAEEKYYKPFLEEKENENS